jgi:DNA anti-recombination protein RmuC
MLVGEFQRVLSQQTQQGLSQGKQELSSQVEHSLETLRIEAQTLDRQLRDSHQSFSAKALDDYKQRLENASNSWLLTTVTKLNQQSETLIGQLADSTEDRLRSTCNKVIAEMGETLRQRLSGLFIPAPPPAPVKSPDTKPEEAK